MQFCPSCGKSVDDEVKFCPHCGNDMRVTAAAGPAIAPQPSQPAPPPAQLTDEQIRAGDKGLTAAALNFLFWGVGYYHAGISRPFGRPWLIWPLVYALYFFISEFIVFSALPISESQIQTTITTGNGSGIAVTTTGPDVFGPLHVKEIEILVLLIFGIVIGFFLARDVYRRVAASSEDPASVPSGRAAIGSFLGRSAKEVNMDAIQKDPATAFTVVGGILLILGSLYVTLLDWLSSQTLNLGGIDELEAAVLGVIMIYLATVLSFRPGWSRPAGVVIIALALITLTVSREYAVELGIGLAIVGGALLVASKPEQGAVPTR